jgi:hypothetical protein
MMPRRSKIDSGAAQAFEDLVRVQDHVRRHGDGDHADEGDESDRVVVDVAEFAPEGDQDERELADLRDGETGEERHPFRIAHHAHDHQHDHRVADEDEDRQHERSRNLRADRCEVELSAELDEEEQQQEVAETRQ